VTTNRARRCPSVGSVTWRSDAWLTKPCPGWPRAVRPRAVPRQVARPVARWWPWPEDIEPLLAIYLAQMGPICANGLLHAAAETVGGPVGSLGDGVRDRHVLVTGAGVVGLMTAMFARLHGAAAVAVSDRTSSRLAAAEGLGLEPVDEGRVEPWRYCKDRWRHGPADRGADVVFQCRGADESLHQAMRSVRPQGTVIDLAFYQGGAGAVRLGEEFHHNGLTIRCAQIARVPRGLQAEWDRARLSAETVQLLREQGSLIRRHLITDIVPFAEAGEVIVELAERKRHAIQLVIAFDGSGAG
jgi:threonine dehydrogenase-like Zn-dependent dehydrogenase